jgi:hypothetical protein
MNSFRSQVSARTNQLKEFQAAIRQFDLKVDSDFQRLIIEGQGFLEISDRELGDALSVSRPTVNRWINGKNLPYNALRKAVFGWIDRQLSKKIRLVNSVSVMSASASPCEASSYPMAAKSS